MVVNCFRFFDFHERALQSFLVVRADLLGGFDETLGLFGIVGLWRGFFAHRDPISNAGTRTNKLVEGHMLNRFKILSDTVKLPHEDDQQKDDDAPQDFASGNGLYPSASEGWESGFQSLGPPRLQTLRYFLTPLDHPEWLWELRRSECNPPHAEEISVAQNEIGAVELCALAGGFLRFLYVAIWAQAKVFLSKKWYRAISAARKDHRQHPRGS
jgi:hypothetical protein